MNRLLLLLLALALTACGAPTPQQPGTPAAGIVETAAATPADDGRVTIGFAAQEAERPAYEPLIEQFERENPGIRIQFVSIDELIRSGDFASLTRRLVTTADTASAFFVSPDDARAGLFRDLAPLIEADPAFDRDDYLPGALEAFSLDGATYALPRTYSISLLSYNKDLFAAAGLPAPRNDMTWDELMALADQLATRRGDTVETYGYADWSNGLVPLLGELRAAGLDVFGTPVAELRLDDERVVQALERVAERAQAGAIYSDPSASAGPGSGIQQLIRDGRVAMWSSELLFQGPGEPEPGFAIGTAAMPPSAAPQFGAGQTYIMSAGTAYPQQAWAWLSFLSRQQIDSPIRMFGAGAEIPARQSVAESSGFWGQLDAERAEAVRAALARPAADLGAAGGNYTAFEPLSQALGAAVGGTSAASALRDAQARLDELVTQAPPTPTPDAAPIVVELPAEEVAAADATRVTFAAFGSDPTVLRQLAREYNQRGEGVFVEVVSPGQQMPTTLAEAAASADCFAWYVPPSGVEETAELLDLQPLMDADATLRADDYPTGLLEPFRHGSGLYGLPQSISLRVLGYAPELFDAAGVPHPTAGWTLEEFLEAAARLSVGDGPNRQYGFASFGLTAEDLLFFLHRSGARVSEGGQPRFTDPQVFAAASQYVDLLRRTSPHTQLQGYRSQESFDGRVFELRREGRVAMWFESSFQNVMILGGPEGPKTAIAPPPGGAQPGTSDVSINGALYISKRAANPQACWSWLKYLTEDVSRLGTSFPARISVAESPEYAAQAPAGAAEVYAAYRDALTSAPPPTWSGSDVELYWLYRAVDRALQGADLEDELAEAQRLTEAFQSCVDGGAPANECAVQVDPTYDGMMVAG